MYPRAVARPGFGELHPFVFGKTSGHDNFLVLDRAGGWNLKGLQLKDEVRLWNGPPLQKSQRRWHVLSIAFWSAGIGPSRDSVHVFSRHRLVIGEFAIMRIGEPGRHLLQTDGFLHRLGPGTRLLIGQQRKRSCFPWTVTSLAVLF